MITPDELRKRISSPSRADRNSAGFLLTLFVTIFTAIFAPTATYLYNQQQVKSARLDTVAKFMPELTSNDPRKQEAALLAISTIGDDFLAIRLASLLQTESSTKVLSRLLLEAARTSDDHLLSILIRTGVARNDAEDQFGYTAVQLAALNDNAAAIEALARAGASIDGFTAKQSEPLVIAARENNLRAFRALKGLGARALRGEAYIIEAARRGNFEILRTGAPGASLIDDSRMVTVLGIRGTAKISALQLAAVNGHVKAVEVLLQLGANPDVRDDQDNTALSLLLNRLPSESRFANIPEITRLLLSAGAKTEVVNALRETPIELAIQGDQLESLSYMLDANADPNFVPTDVPSRHPLTVAAAFGRASAASLLIQRGVAIEFNEGDPLREAARSNHPKVVGVLLKARANPNRRRAHEPPALQLAAQSRNSMLPYLNEKDRKKAERESLANKWTTIDLLLHGGADANAVDVDGESVLHHAALSSDVVSFEKIFNRSKAPDAVNRKGETPLAELLDSNDRGDRRDIIKFLVEHGARLDVRTRDGSTPFLLAARRCDFALELLLSKGVPVNDKNNDGETALHLAIPYQSDECVDKLIAAHVPIDEPDSHGMTPLMVASQNNKLAVVGELLRAGADKFKKNKDGHTAAELSNDPEVRSAFN